MDQDNSWAKLFSGVGEKTELTRILQIKNKLEESFALGEDIPTEYRSRGEAH